MAKYRANAKTWLSHENRMVQEGEEFETSFPDGMKIGGNLTELDIKKTRTRTKTEAPAAIESTDEIYDILAVEVYEEGETTA
jgi:hypothetical protein